MCALASWWAPLDLNSDIIELVIARCSYKWDDVARALPDRHTGERYFKDSELQCVEDDEVSKKRKFREALRKWHGASAEHGLHELCAALDEAQQGRFATEIVDRVLQKLANNRQIEKGQIVQELSCQICLRAKCPVTQSPASFRMMAAHFETRCAGHKGRNKGQGNEEQRAYWVPLARDFRIIGCYAQTELGHGTFLRGLETRAEYDQTTEEFILYTPTQTAMKWWPGSMGKTATHALVIARLFLAGRERGIHMFVVPLRDRDTHEPLPGINVGNIGPRLGYNPVDNGFLGLKKVRIPRTYMMMRYTEVTPDGRLVSHISAKKPAYGTMLYIRAYLLWAMARKLSCAVTIAVRYSAVRQQGFFDTKASEVAVLDYVSQQSLLFPLLATSFAYMYVGRWMVQEYEQHSPENVSQIQELHATSSCLKAISASVAVRGVETCRRACGGHGYSAFSGLPRIYQYTTAAETYEGDAPVLFLQAARYLMKALHVARSGSVLTGSIKYLTHWLSTAPGSTPIVASGSSLADPFVLANVFECSAARMVALAGEKLGHFLKQAELSKEQAWNRAAPWLIRAAEAHGEAILFVRFASIVDTKLSRPVRKLMKSCMLLYGLWRIEQNTMFFLETGTLTPSHVQSVHELVVATLTVLRPEAVSLVDAFDHADELLHSALGAYDGDVYTRLYDYARKEPLNQTQVADGIHEYLKPLMKTKV